MLVVGVDCWALRLNGGGARYVFESIFTHLSKEEEVKWILFLHPEAAECIHNLQLCEGLFKSAIKIVINSPSEIAKYDKHVDVYYSPFNNISFRYFDKPVVSLLHDVQERFLPELFQPNDLEGRLEDYDDIVKSSTRVVTISNFCKQSLIDFCGGDLNKLDVIYNAPQESLLKYTNSDLLKSKQYNFGLVSHDYVFYPANFYTHKNHQRLLEAYSQLLKKQIALPRLVLMGKGFDVNTNIDNIINEFKLKDHVVILSDLSPEGVAWLYMHSKFVVIPTLFEGFCMPAVEAIAFNKQVLCSNLDILVEVTSNQALYFDPYKVEDIALQISKVLNNGQHPNCFNLSDQYNWANSASKTLKVIKSALAEYVPENIIVTANESHFTIVIICEQVIVSDLQLTIDSVIKQKYKAGYLHILLLSDSDSDSDSVKGCYLIQENNSSLDITVCESQVAVKQNLSNKGNTDNYFSILTSGNLLANNYFINSIKALDQTSCNLLVGEVSQVHEDQVRTFESSNYFRIIRGNLVLKGTLYPEMFVSTSREYLFQILETPSLIWEYFLESKKNEQIIVARHNLSSVMYKTSLKFQRQQKRSKAVNYSPESFQRNANVDNLKQLHENQAFLDVVNTKVAQGLGCVTPPIINEIDIVLQQITTISELESD
jgi:glycosyltransferase involved in cell wall biosynthesis